MMHLRVVCESADSDAAIEFLNAEPGIAHLTVTSGASRQPAGDLVEAVIARESAERVFDQLTELGVNRRGEISLEPIETILSDSADAAERAAPGEGADAVIWDELLTTTGEESRLNPVFLAFLTIACLLAAVGVIIDSPVTIVGAMVVSPDFGPLSALAVAIVSRRRDLATRAFLALSIGFPLAMVVTAGLALIARLCGLFDANSLSHIQQVAFVYQVGPFSVIVALLAGAAGMIALTSQKSGALIGVFISATTVPAAGFAMVAAVTGQWDRCGEALLQLLVNLVGLTVAGTLTLMARRSSVRPAKTAARL